MSTEGKARRLYVLYHVVMHGVTESKASDAWVALDGSIRGRAERAQWRHIARYAFI